MSNKQEQDFNITEEDIIIAMIEHDFVAKILPKKKYKIQVLVKNIKKGEPRSVKEVML